MKSYNVGVLGNCCTHGAGICNMFKGRSDTRVIAAYEENSRRAEELQHVFDAPLSTSYEAVINHPEVDFVAVTCDPCDKADMVELPLLRANTFSSTSRSVKVWTVHAASLRLSKPITSISCTISRWSVLYRSMPDCWRKCSWECTAR